MNQVDAKTKLSQIVESFIRGDQRAFNDLFRMYNSRLEKYAYSFLNDRDEAQDLVQDVFVQLWRTRNSIDTSKDFSSFLFVSVKNKCLNALKHRLVKDKFALSQINFASEELYEMSFDVKDDFTSMEEKLSIELEHIIAQMPERCGVAFRLKWLDGRKIKDIAGIMQISTTMVDKHLTKGMQIAREKMTPELFLFFFMQVN